MTVELKSDIDNNIEISAFGDIMMGVSSIHAIAERTTIPQSIIDNYQEICCNVRPLLIKSDICIGNLECVISRDYDNYPIDNPILLMAPIEAIHLLKECNITIVNLSNNHILDHGLDPVIETIGYLTSNQIEFIGAPKQLGYKVLLVKSIKGKKIGFLGYNLCKQGEYSCIDDIYRDITKSLPIIDFLIVILHWGFGCEHMPKPSPEQIKIAHQIIDLGADLIIGHHSHTLQPIESYKGKIIAYSLGNFLFDMPQEINRRSGILKINIKDDNSFIVKLIPIINIKNKIFIDTENSEKLNEIIYSPELLLIDNYYDIVRKNKRKYYFGILKFYIKNFNKYSLIFHINFINRWIYKFYRMNSLKNKLR